MTLDRRLGPAGDGLGTRRAAAAILSVTAALLVPVPAHADRTRDDQWHLRFLHVAGAHRISQGAGVTVAVVDSGVDLHRDLINNVLPGVDLWRGSGDGRTDADGHGTLVAGLIAAHGRGRDEGALGMAPRAKILPVRYYDGTADPRPGSLATGIRWAVDRGVDVICLSIGGGPNEAERAAVEAALAADVVVVAAVGNQPRDRVVQFPAAYPGVVAVAAIGRDGNIAPVSVGGDRVVIAAPGVDIVGTGDGESYLRGTGTSGATAIVAGAVALIRSRYPDLSAAEVVHRITATATDKGPRGRDSRYGYGVLDLLAALTADVPPPGVGGPATSAPPTAATTTAAARPGDRDGGGLDRRTVVGAAAVAALILGGLASITRRRRPGGVANRRPGRGSRGRRW